jgi:hypothetical protein
MLPDWPAEHPGATRKKQAARIIERVAPDAPLPDKLCTRLGQPIRVGQLEVTPEKVERTRITYLSRASDRKARLSAEDGLLLTLLLRNVSADVFFIPTDPAFSAKWKPGRPKPYTFLEIGGQRFYGGPLARHQAFPAADSSGEDLIQGQEDDQLPLEPGQARRTVISSDPHDRQILAQFAQESKNCQWRVHLRRGLVSTRDGEVSATAVVGVRFNSAEVSHRRD